MSDVNKLLEFIQIDSNIQFFLNYEKYIIKIQTNDIKIKKEKIMNDTENLKAMIEKKNLELKNLEFNGSINQFELRETELKTEVSNYEKLIKSNDLEIKSLNKTIPKKGTFTNLIENLTISSLFGKYYSFLINEQINVQELNTKILYCLYCFFYKFNNFETHNYIKFLFYFLFEVFSKNKFKNYDVILNTFLKSLNQNEQNIFNDNYADLNSDSFKNLKNKMNDYIYSLKKDLTSLGSEIIVNIKVEQIYPLIIEKFKTNNLNDDIECFKIDDKVDYCFHISFLVIKEIHKECNFKFNNEITNSNKSDTCVKSLEYLKNNFNPNSLLSLQQEEKKFHMIFTPMIFKNLAEDSLIINSIEKKQSSKNVDYGSLDELDSVSEELSNQKVKLQYSPKDLRTLNFKVLMSLLYKFGVSVNLQFPEVDLDKYLDF